MTLQERPVKLKRAIGLLALTLFGLGNIVGAGIYVLIGDVTAHAGVLTPLAFLIASFVAAFSALSYAEMSSRFPLSAGAAVYVDEGLGIKQLSMLAGLMVASVGVVSSATIIQGSYGYLQIFIELPFSLVIAMLVITIGSIVIWGITQSVFIAAFITIAEIAGLLVVIWAGKHALIDLPAHVETASLTVESRMWMGILPAAFLAFFAFLGFEDIVNVAEEVKNPTRNLPLAILIALILSTILYFLVSMVAVLTVEADQLSGSDAPLATVFQAATGNNPYVLSLLGIIAIINGALVQIVMSSRVLYGMANKGLLWRPLSIVNRKTQTPVYSTLLVLAIILPLALWIPLEKLAATTSLLMLSVFALVNFSLIAIKRRERYARLPGRYPVWIPVTGLVSSLLLVISVLWF